jgi:hypothetical protein
MQAAELAIAQMPTDEAVNNDHRQRQSLSSKSPFAQVGETLGYPAIAVGRVVGAPLAAAPTPGAAMGPPLDLKLSDLPVFMAMPEDSNAPSGRLGAPMPPLDHGPVAKTTKRVREVMTTAGDAVCEAEVTPLHVTGRRVSRCASSLICGACTVLASSPNGA